MDQLNHARSHISPSACVTVTLTIPSSGLLKYRYGMCMCNSECKKILAYGEIWLPITQATKEQQKQRKQFIKKNIFIKNKKEQQKQ